MPRVPTVGLSASPRPAFQAPGVIAPRNYAPQQIQQAGKAMEGMGRVITDIAFKVENDINDAATLNGVNTIENFGNGSLLEFKQLKRDNATTVKKTYLKGMQDEIDRVARGLGNDIQRRMFSKAADRIKSRFDLGIESHYVKAAAESKQHQLGVTRVTIENALYAEPLGPNAVPLFLRWRNIFDQELDGQGITGEAAKAERLSGSSKLITNMFNSYADGEQPESAVVFLKNIEAFEQASLEAVQGPQGPQSLRGKTYEEAKAAAADPQDPQSKKPKRTTLTKKEELEFQKAYAAIVKQREATGEPLDPNPDDPLHKYDYRGAWKAGKLGVGPDNHFLSRWKDDDHPNRFVRQPDGTVIDSKHDLPVETVGPVIDKLTRKKLHEQAAKIVHKSWVRDEANSLLEDSDNPADALQQASIIGAANGWTESQINDVEEYIYNKSRQVSILSNQASTDAFEAAKQEFLENQEETGKGFVSESTKKALGDARAYDDYRQWVNSPRSGGGSGGRSGTSSTTDAGVVFLSVYNNKRGYGTLAKEIRSKAREGGRVPTMADIGELAHHLVTKKGLSKADTLKIVEGVSGVLFPEDRDEQDLLAGDLREWSESYFRDNLLKSRTSMGDPGSATRWRSEGGDEGDAKYGHVVEIFKKDVNRLFRSERKDPANDKKDHHTLLDEVMSTVLKRKELRLPDKEGFGGVDVVNGWFLSNSERELAYAKIAGPEAILNTIEEMRGTQRLNPDGSYSNETYFEAAVKSAALTKTERPAAQEAASLLGTFIQGQIDKEAGLMRVAIPWLDEKSLVWEGTPLSEVTPAEWAQKNRYKLSREMLSLGIPQDFFEIAGTSPGSVITEEEIFLHGMKIKEEDEQRKRHASADGVRSALFFINSFVSDPKWLEEETRGMTADERAAMAGPMGYRLKSRLLEDKIRGRLWGTGSSRWRSPGMMSSFLHENKLGVSLRQFEAAMQMHPAIRTRILGITTRPYGLSDTGPTRMNRLAQGMMRALHGASSWRTVTDAEFESLVVVHDEDDDEKKLKTLGGAYIDRSKMPPEQQAELSDLDERTEREARASQRERGIRNLMKPQKERAGYLGSLIDWAVDAPIYGRTREEAEKEYDERTTFTPPPGARFGDWFVEEFIEDSPAEIIKKEKKLKAEARRRAEVAERMKGFK
jgi:hypothetical protein